MASRGILRRCASSSSCGDATLDFLRTFSSSSACASFGCEETSQLEPCAVRRSGLEEAEQIASGAVSHQVSGEFGHGGWCCVPHWTERLCTNLSQVDEMRNLLSTNVGHQALGTRKTRAPRGWSIDFTEPLANGVKFGTRRVLSQEDQAGSVWSTVGARTLSTSTSSEDLSRSHQDNDSPMEHTGEKDLDYYMRSRYNEEPPNSTETDSETEPETEPETEAEDEPAQTEDDLLSKLKRNERGKYDNVAAVLGDPRVLAAAHERLNQRRKNWTLSSNELEISHLPRENRTLRSREIDHNWYREAAYQLRTGSFVFQPPRRVDIARRGRGEARQLVFVRPREQVVQEAVRGLLERVYGARETPGESVHSALKAVKQGWRGVAWFLQFDVRVRDRESVQRRLLQLVAEQIEDQVFLEALRRMFEAGTVWIDTDGGEEKPEGSVLSPVLGDLYFRRLDLEISRIREELNSEVQV